MKEFQRGGLFAGFRQATPAVRAVRGVSLSIDRGEALGLAGESGSGKTTIGRCIMGLEVPTRGEVRFGGQVISQLDRGALRRLRPRLQMVFQDPPGSLNPRMSVRQTLDEPLRLLTDAPAAERRARASEILDEVGLSNHFMRRYPQQLSGGQQQRVSIARALIVNPDFVVLDEPVSALDASVRWQVLELLETLRDRHQLSYLYISHDLDTVKALCKRVAIMFGGSIVEAGSVASIFSKPTHPYTRMLLGSVLEPNPEQRRRRRIERANTAVNKGKQSLLPADYQPPLVLVGEDHYAASATTCELAAS